MLKTLNLSLLAIMATAIILVPLSISSFQQQQAYAPRDCPSCGEFKKLTHELEKNVIGLVGNPNEGPIPHLRELVDAYAQDVNRIFLGGPDTLPELLAQYQQEVLAVFQNPPDPDKQQQHDQIKEFRQLTHTFEKSVIGAINPPEPE